jgi:hypothetical protein
MMSDDKQLLGKRNSQEKQVLSELKQRNKERVKQGLEPIFAKRRELKEQKFQKKFDEL